MTLEINELLLNNLGEIQIKLELLEKLRMTQRQASKNYFLKNKSTIYEQRKKRKEEMTNEQIEEINRKNRESARNRYINNIEYQIEKRLKSKEYQRLKKGLTLKIQPSEIL